MNSPRHLADFYLLMLDIFNAIHEELNTMPDLLTLGNRCADLSLAPQPQAGETRDTPAYQERVKKSRAAYVEAIRLLNRRGSLEEIYLQLFSKHASAVPYNALDSAHAHEYGTLPRQYAEKVKDPVVREKLLKEVAKWELTFPPPKKKPGKK